MKNMKKLLRKAMVFTLTAAMLVGTPLTASAASLVDLYKVEDGEGNLVKDQGDPNNSRTGTVTVTQTYTTTLEADNEPVGIYLDNSNVELEYPTPGSLTAKIEWNVEDAKLTANDKALEADMLKNLVWKSSDTAVVALEVPDGKYNKGSREKINLNPKAFGPATVTVSLNSKNGKYNFSDTATVNVKQYATDLAFDKEIDKVAFIGDSINLDDYVERYVDGKIKDGTARKVPATSDILTFSLKADPAKAATLKNGILTINKSAKEGDKIRILAIGQNSKDKVGTGWYDLTIKPGNNAKKIVIVDKNDKTIKKTDLKVNDGLTLDVTAKVTKKEKNDSACTNKISWESKNPEIVAVESATDLTDNKSTATLKAKHAGKAQIIAKTSNGKSATLTVTVKGDLTMIDINASGPLYNGQTVDLYDTAVQHFAIGGKKGTTGNEKLGLDAGLKWTFADGKAKTTGAKISAKGVLTINPDAKAGKITVKASKKVGNDNIEATKEIELKVVNITSITVTRANMVKEATANNDGKKVKSVKGKDTIDVGEVVYTLVAKGKKYAGDNDTTGEDLSPEEARAALGWTASGKNVKASKTADNNGLITAIKKGSATITINAATKNKNGKYVAIKTTIKDTIKAPTTTLSLKVKNKGIAAKTSNQTITITPVLEKGSTTKNGKDIVWTATKNDEKITTITNKGKLTLAKGSYNAGDVIKVTARVNKLTATVVLQVVEKSAKPVFTGTDVKKSKLTWTLKEEEYALPEVSRTITVTVNGKTPGDDDGKVSTVTYTVDRPDIVRIKEDKEKPGELQINAVTAGTAKITATTLDGQKQTLKVTVKADKDKIVGADFWKQNQ